MAANKEFLVGRMKELGKKAADESTRKVEAAVKQFKLEEDPNIGIDGLNEFIDSDDGYMLTNELAQAFMEGYSDNWFHPLF